MGLPESPWDNSSFPSMGDITCGTIACTNWPRANLRQIGYTVYVFTDLYINTALVVNPNVNLMGPFTSTDANVEPLCVHNKIYLPTPFSDSSLSGTSHPWRHGPVSAASLLMEA